ncbi:hypothetical protein [Hydrogenophaga sp.]|uniref:hypothetical protein n=1 Tax=Hydrogenophaga sp. TaxID=1904254 RepID=UPI002724D9D2|nr:hypothetical protein [Hydrogenophaga sp.]MDO9434327.1 hypothetical protein [Hydrogenophaga sp.]
MKRTAPHDFSTQPRAPVNRRAEVPPVHPAQALPDNTNEPAPQMLAEPVRGYEGRTLDAVLRDPVARAEIEAHPDVDTYMSDAIFDCVIALNLGDPSGLTNATDPKVVPYVARILFHLGQSRLLCKLAILNKAQGFELNVGAFAERAALLAGLAASWPKDLAVSIGLSVFLPAAALQDLKRFVQGMSTLRLSITSDQREVDRIDASEGLSADDIAEHERAVIEFVRESGARELRVSRHSPNETLSARLVASRSEWDKVELEAFYPSYVIQWPISAQQTIRQLALVGCLDPYYTPDVAELLAWAEKRGVRTIVFEHGMGIGRTIGGLELHASRSTHVFERIEATFFEDRVDADVLSEAFDLLSNNPTIGSLVHVPSEYVDEILLRDELTARLSVIDTVNQLATPAERMARAQRAVVKRWKDTGERLGAFLLRDDEHVQALDDYLKGTLNPLVSTNTSTGRPPAVAWNLEAKLSLLRWWSIDERLIKDAVAHCVSQNPSMAPRMCQALMRVGVTLSEPPPATWERLGALFKQTWLGERQGMQDVLHWVEPLTPFDPHAPRPAPPADAAPVPGAERVPVQKAPPGQMDPQSLVTPGDAQTLAALVARFQRAFDHFNQPAHLNPARRTASAFVLNLLQTGRFDPARAKHPYVSSELPRLLLKAGQGKLLRKLIEWTPVPSLWAVHAEGAGEIAALADVKPWPRFAECVCVLTVPLNTSTEAGERIVEFASTVPSDQLQMSLTPRKYTDPGIVQSIIKAHPGMGLRWYGEQAPVELEPTIDLLNAVHSTRLSRVTFQDIPLADPRLVQAAIGLVKASGANTLGVTNCAPALTEALLSCRHWEELRLSVDTGMSSLFKEGKVVAEKLIIRRNTAANAMALDPNAFQKEVKTMVKHCRGLTSLEFFEVPVNVLALARGLKNGTSVRSVIAAFTMDSIGQANEAMRLLRKCTSLVHVRLLKMALAAGGLPLDVAFRTELLQLATRNRLRHPVLSGIGAGKGFGHSLGKPAMREIGPNIVARLSSRDVVALSLTSKAAYLGSRQPWQTEMDRLAKLLLLTDAQEFKTKLMLQLSSLDDSFNTLPNTAVVEKMPAATLSEKVSFMRAAEASDHAIGQALGRALIDVLKTDPASSRAYMEAMVLVGAPAVPAQEWLKEVIGV